MLVRELIVGHLGRQGALHERGIRVNQSDVPPGIRVHHDGDAAVAPVAGDLLLVTAPVGTGLPEHVDAHLPVGVTVVLLFEVEVADLPVGRVLAALAVAGLQVLEAAVVSGVQASTIAVVATRTNKLVVPAPSLAHDLEPGNNKGPAAMARILGEHALEGLVRPARERVLLAKAAEVGTRLAQVTAEVEQLRADRHDHEVLVAEHEVTVRDLEISRTDADSARAEADSALKKADGAREQADSALKEADTARRRLQTLQSSRSFRVASRLARVSGVARRVVRRPVHGPPPSAE